MKKVIQILMLFGFIVSSAQTYFEVEKEFDCNCGGFTQNLSDLKVYQEKEIDDLYEKIINTGMSFNYPQGGCQQRAEKMHMIMENSGIEHAKIWLFAPVNLSHTDKTYLEIDDPNDLTPNDIIYWGYHVAPSVLVESVTTGRLDTLVIDPSVSRSKPLRINNWFEKINNSDVSKYTFLESKNYFFNVQPSPDGSGNLSSVINGYFYTYGDVESIVDMYDNAVVERELAVNDVAIFMLEKIKTDYEDHDGQIKRLLGNVEDMIALFASEQRNNNFYSTNMRSVLDSHCPFINEALVFYHSRVLYWLNHDKQ
jgi:hypothetical protein